MLRRAAGKMKGTGEARGKFLNPIEGNRLFPLLVVLLFFTLPAIFSFFLLLF